MTKEIPDNVIPFPMHRVQPEKQEMSYHQIAYDTSPEDLSNKELVFCINNTALCLLGDAYDEKFWSRRIAALMKLGIALDHPSIRDVFPDIEETDTIIFEKDRFDVCVTRGKEVISVIELKCLADLGENQLQRYTEKLKKKKSPGASRFVVSLFDLDITQIPSPWYELGLTYFSTAFADLADALIKNPEIANDFNNCHDFLVLISELIYRFNTLMNDFTENENGMDEMKPLVQNTGFFKPFDRIVKSYVAAKAMRLLAAENQDAELVSGNTNGNNFFNISTSIAGVDVGIQYQNNAVKLYRNSSKSTPFIDDKVLKIAEDITGKKGKFSTDRGKGFRSIRLNERGKPADVWSLDGKSEVIELILRSIRDLNKA